MRRRFDLENVLEILAKIFVVATIAFVVGVVLAGIGYTIAGYQNENTYTVTLEEKFTKRHGESDSYMLFTETEGGEKRVFRNSDALFVGKFDSADLQAGLEEGKKYKFTTIGFRIPFLSAFENVIEVKEVKQ